jgi:predicted RNA-binding protein
MYMRLVGTSLDVYNYLEPLLNDYRKLKVKNKMGGENNCENSVHPHLNEDDCKSF